MENKKLLKSMFSLSEDDIKLISNACAEHRASYHGKYSHMLSEIISSADRSIDGNPKSLYMRSYIYARSKGNKNINDAIDHSIEHIYEKYSRKGYIQYPPLFIKMNKKVLEKLWNDLDRMNDTIKNDKLFWISCEKVYLTKKFKMIIR